jgi:DNA-binding HxlR family transcriptional regulator
VLDAQFRERGPISSQSLTKDGEFARHSPATVGNVEQVARIRALRCQAQRLLFTGVPIRIGGWWRCTHRGLLTGRFNQSCRPSNSKASPDHIPSGSRAFDATLAAAGGSQPVWLILVSLKTRQLVNQRELAQAVGIQGATLTHHLNATEADGLPTRQRDPANRRVHQVHLTERRETLFDSPPRPWFTTSGYAPASATTT